MKTFVQRRELLVCVLLALAVAAIYLPVFTFDFVNYDDPAYVYGNPHITCGLSWPSVLWAFTTSYAANYHPLTWISHMADCEVFGLNAGCHHLANVFLHAGNGILLLLWLRCLTGRFWPSVLVAGLFALHPMRVESVAWVSERKDVLSTFFGLLALWSYTSYAREAKSRARAVGWYLLSLAFFAAGLLSKPMLVTWPCLMLLVDYWPLSRFAASGRAFELQRFRRLLLEKTPFFAFSIAISVATLLAQHAAGAVAKVSDIPFGPRLTNVAVGYIEYLLKLAWPENLAVLYPYVRTQPLIKVAMALVLIIGVSCLALFQRRQRPWFAFGWCWYLVTLVPVIGLIQVGNQFIADRYTYVPSIGILVIAVWAGAEITAAHPCLRLPAVLASGAAMIACVFSSQAQVMLWQNTETLFRHTLAVTRNNYIACNNLGFFYAEHGAFEAAKKYYRLALEIKPDYQSAYNNLGCVLVTQGRLEEAATNFEAALRADPMFADALCNLGSIDSKLGRHEAAGVRYREALRINPNHVGAHRGLAVVLEAKGDFEAAAVQYAEICRLRPEDTHARVDLGRTLIVQGKMHEAAEQLRLAVRGQPEARAHHFLAIALHSQGKVAEALPHYREAARLAPKAPLYLNDLAWVLATSPEDRLRNGAEAVRLAEAACRLSGSREACYWGTLDAAYAEVGRFDEALEAAGKACQLAASAGQSNLVKAAEDRILLYREKKPFRQ